jgi:dipeptidyl aminopeptidase/acylaminoacyl peptidase
VVNVPKITANGNQVFVLHSSMASPSGIYMYNIASQETKCVSTQNSDFDLSLLRSPESIWYPSFDGINIHGWYLPAIKSSEHTPAVIFSHGGPWAQARDEWVGPFSQILSQNGYASFTPNFRGSTGYGSDFQFMDIGDVGGGDLEDVIFAVKWMKSNSKIDENKIGIIGGSYGGFLTLMALGKKPLVFSAGISINPTTDWIASHNLADMFFKQFTETLFEGPPDKKEDLYKKCSPITYVDNICVPVLIISGKNDSRCPFEPVEKFVEKLKTRDQPHEFVILEETGHIPVSDLDLRVKRFSKLLEFFEKNLK